MAKIDNSMECIDSLTDKMLAKGLTCVHIKDGELEIKLERKTEVRSAPAQTVAVQQTVQPSSNASDCPPVPNGKVLKAPIVGTFYSAPSPKDPPFVTIGKEVKKGDVLFIIESMKVMNEIKSEYDGTVIIINIKDGEVVEFDQPVMIIS